MPESQLKPTVSPDHIDPVSYLNKEELASYSVALELAHLANQAFDVRISSANQLSTHAGMGYPVITSRANRDVPPYLIVHSMFDALVTDAVALMPTQDRFKPKVEAETAIAKIAESEIYLSSEQRDGYNESTEIAYMANQVFDARMHFAKEIVAFSRRGLNIHAALDETRAYYLEIHNMFRSLVSDAAALMPPIEAFRPSLDVKKLADHETWVKMSPEQLKNALLIADDWVTKFAEFGVDKDSLRIVTTLSEQGEEEFTLVDVGDGINFGEDHECVDSQRTYDAIMWGKNNPCFTTSIGGKVYDARSGMTISVYDAMIDDAIVRESTVLRVLRTQFDSYRTKTLMTGEQQNFGRISACTTSGVGVYLNLIHTQSGAVDLRFRPAVKL
ncbi:MAG TPA: hypothetical protein VIH90_03630 [Candidatus Saccharimonadales bacterium]